MLLDALTWNFIVLNVHRVERFIHSHFVLYGLLLNLAKAKKIV